MLKTQGGNDLETEQVVQSVAEGMLTITDMRGRYQRWENNGWRLVSDRVMKRVDQDPVVYESTLKKQSFNHSKVSMHDGKYG